MKVAKTCQNFDLTLIQLSTVVQMEKKAEMWFLQSEKVICLIRMKIFKLCCSFNKQVLISQLGMRRRVVVTESSNGASEETSCPKVAPFNPYNF